MADTEMTREALYDLVWQRPISKLAPEFGTTDAVKTKSSADGGEKNVQRRSGSANMPNG